MNRELIISGSFKDANIHIEANSPLAMFTVLGLATLGAGIAVYMISHHEGDSPNRIDCSEGLLDIFSD